MNGSSHFEAGDAVGARHGDCAPLAVRSSRNARIDLGKNERRPKAPFMFARAADQVFWMTMLGNLEEWSTAKSPTFTATRRAIWR